MSLYMCVLNLFRAYALTLNHTKVVLAFGLQIHLIYFTSINYQIDRHIFAITMLKILNKM